MTSKRKSLLVCLIVFIVGILSFLLVLLPGTRETSAFGVTYFYAQYVLIFGGISNGIAFGINIYLLLIYQVILCGFIVCIISYASSHSLVFGSLLIIAGGVALLFEPQWISFAEGATAAHMSLDLSVLIGAPLFIACGLVFLCMAVYINIVTSRYSAKRTSVFGFFC